MSLKVIIVPITHEQWLVMLMFKGETGKQGKKYEHALLCIDLLHVKKQNGTDCFEFLESEFQTHSNLPQMLHLKGSSGVKCGSGYTRH